AAPHRLRGRPGVASLDAVARADSGDLRPSGLAAQPRADRGGGGPPPLGLRRQRAAPDRVDGVAARLGAGSDDAAERQHARAGEDPEARGQAPARVRAPAGRPRSGGHQPLHEHGHVAFARPRAGRARCQAPAARRPRVELRGPRRLARRERDPGRGHPAGAASGSDLRPRAVGRLRHARGAMTETLVLEDPAEECAGRLAAAAAAGSHIALTGGGTPKVSYLRLAGMDVDWSGTTLWFGDERCVPPDDERSNYRMAKEALLDRLPSPDEGGPEVRRMLAERGPSAGAEDYERQLRERLGEELPRFDV